MIRLSSRGTYAMLIMLELCSCAPGKYIPLRNIAAKYGLSTKYLERVIMLKTDYLKTLPVGTHKLTVVYTDGECSTNFVVKQVASTGDKDITSPQTGDNSNLALWFALMPVSGAGTLVTVVNRKRKYHIIGNIHKYARPEDVPEHTMFVITTDGQENASHRYSSEQVKKMIERQKEKYGWEFLFIGANIDAVETAARYGIDKDRAVNYNADGHGTHILYESVAKAVCNVRASAPLGADWSEEINADYQRRGKKNKK